MAHFAKVKNGIVTQVLVVDNEHEDDGEAFLNSLGFAGRWIKTSYNTFANQHELGGQPLRKNYAGVGYVYDEARDAFIPPKTYESWVLNEQTCQWDPPSPFPGPPYVWDEESVSWIIPEPK